jgi:hypothetical protein
MNRKNKQRSDLASIIQLKSQAPNIHTSYGCAASVALEQVWTIAIVSGLVATARLPELIYRDAVVARRTLSAMWALIPTHAQ